jgi:phosphatidylinositol kinase/protein kinase (PI-3  family)
LIVIFKKGDDLKQDNLIMQFFRIMDKLWLSNNLDLEMLTYNIMETGYKIGFIECVPDSKTFAELNWEMGLCSPIKEKSIFKYIFKNKENIDKL